MVLGMLMAIQNRSDPPLEDDFSLKELRCYNLPFGALGFISHILTYYTLVCLWYGRKPLWPFHKISNTKLDLALGAIGIILCIVMSMVTIINCKNTWQLLVIAVWKLSMSLLNGLTALHVAILIVGNSDPEAESPMKTKQAAWWVVLYVPGMIAGMSGLMSLVAKTADKIPQVLGLTLTFYAIVGASLIVSILTMMIICWRGGGSPGKVALTGCVVTLALFIVLSAFYSDWCLGLMLDNLWGTPSSDKSAFYWTYFAAKRLSMFSW